jgi:hypothetical protein
VFLRDVEIREIRIDVALTRLSEVRERDIGDAPRPQVPNPLRDVLHFLVGLASEGGIARYSLASSFFSVGSGGFGERDDRLGTVEEFVVNLAFSPESDLFGALPGTGLPCANASTFINGS